MRWVLLLHRRQEARQGAGLISPKPVTEVPSGVQGAPVPVPPLPMPPSLPHLQNQPPGCSTVSFLFLGSGLRGLSDGPDHPHYRPLPCDQMADLARLHTQTPTTTTTTQTKVHCEPPFGLLLVGALKLQC
uniref:Uncharacterized protein n=1 Tax=Nomascus leucogenys TaxID=61853 RepID=A0A2I3GDB8_NOMLE